ncbi:MAG: glycosyltransferase family 2 protein [Bacteroidetes bacterium]|nr:glycosyltransferase family 2 protein [Bacteroidota bacterium]
MSTKGVSIIICCYNSEPRIEATLSHLLKQERNSSFPWEIILVDNKCTDGTVSLAAQLYNASKVDASFKVIEETTPGLSYARIKGLREAQYDYVLYCDDDNWLAPNYLDTAYAIMNEHPEIGVLGGRGAAVTDGELPYWFTTYQGSFACGVQATESGDISGRGYVWGAGFMIQKAVLLKCLDLGFEFFCSDRMGKKLMSGGDSEVCKWYLLAKTKLWYDDRLIFQHYMPQNRLTKEHLEKLFEGFEICNKYLDVYDLVIADLAQPTRAKKRKTVKLFSDLLWASLFQSKEKIAIKKEIQRLYPDVKRFAVDHVYRDVYSYYIRYHNL